MSKTLNRVLRLRMLREESCRLELEAASQQLSRFERTMDRLEDESNKSRDGAFACLCEGDAREWMVHQAAREFAEWQADALAVHRQAQAAVVDSVREVFLESRKQTGQVETLVKTYEQLLRIEQSRRDQAALDEWFNLRRQRAQAARSRKVRRHGEPEKDLPRSPRGHGESNR